MKKNKPIKRIKSTRGKPVGKKAVCLLSGGLDSALAARLVKDQGIEVYCVFFKTPFFACGEPYAKSIAKRMSMPFKTIELGPKYLEMLRKPAHGYGSALNPCIDCHIMMLREALKYARKIGASFIVTGEVLGQRPKSQQMDELSLIEKESGLEGKLLRPLSARLLPITEAEAKKWVNPDSFPTISGRGRTEQFSLARKMGIRRFQSPAGGCLLSYREYAAKLRDLLTSSPKISRIDIELLRVGRHFRHGKCRIIVGKNEEENKKLLKTKSKSDYYLEADERIPSPITVVKGSAGPEDIKAAAMLTAFYSDAKSKKVRIFYGKKKLEHSIVVAVPERSDVEKMRIAWK